MESTGSRSDEIDLLHLLVKIFRFLLKNWLVIVLSVAICVVISWVSYKNAPKSYRGSMVIRSEFLSESYATQMVDHLQVLFKDRNDSLLSAKLNIPLADVGSINNIRIEPLPGANPAQSELDKMVYMVVVEASRPSILPKAQEGLVYYFDNQEFLKTRVAERKKVYKDLIERIDSEINGASDGDPGGLYLTKNSKSKDREAKNKSTILFDPSTVRVYMFKDRMEAEEKLSLLRGVEVVDGFMPTVSPSKPNRVVFLAGGLSSGFFLAILILGFRALQRLNKRYPA